jgi:beta-phosphoglucomutase-like phosphatase (HAD superfamily)
MDAAFIFDLDGMLVDSVYQLVRPWKEALNHEGQPPRIRRVPRRIVVGGGPSHRYGAARREITPDPADRLRWPSYRRVPRQAVRVQLPPLIHI